MRTVWTAQRLESVKAVLAKKETVMDAADALGINHLALRKAFKSRGLNAVDFLKGRVGKPTGAYKDVKERPPLYAPFACAVLTGAEQWNDAAELAKLAKVARDVIERWVGGLAIPPEARRAIHAAIDGTAARKGNAA